MRAERALIGARGNDGRIDYIRVSRFPYEHAMGRNEPPDALRLCDDDDDAARALVAYGDLCTLVSLHIQRPCSTSHCEWLKREQPARVKEEAAYLAEARRAGAHLAALYDAGAWAVWLIPPDDARDAVTAALAALDAACDAIQSGVAGFEMSLRSPARGRAELRAQGRKRFRAAGPEIRKAFERARWLSSRWNRPAIWYALMEQARTLSFRNRPVEEALEAARELAAELQQERDALRSYLVQIDDAGAGQPTWRWNTVTTGG